MMFETTRISLYRIVNEVDWLRYSIRSCLPEFCLHGKDFCFTGLQVSDNTVILF